MKRPALALAVLAAVGLAAPTRAAHSPAPACEGTISGSATGTFQCTATLVARGDQVFFSIDGTGPVDGLASYVPGAFELGAAKPGTYTMAELGMGRASVAVEGGAMYAASKTSSVRGEVTLVLQAVKPDAKVKGAFVAHGTYRARLVPATSGKTGEVVVEVRF